jgi:hypothetical protein
MLYLLGGLPWFNPLLVVPVLELLAVQGADVTLRPHTSGNEFRSLICLGPVRTAWVLELQSVRKGSEGGVPAAIVRLDRLQAQSHQVHVELTDEVRHILQLRLEERADFSLCLPHSAGDLAPIDNRSRGDVPGLSHQVSQCDPVDFGQLEADRQRNVTLGIVRHSNPVAGSRLHSANDSRLDMAATFEVLGVRTHRADEVDYISVQVVDPGVEHLLRVSFAP